MMTSFLRTFVIASLSYLGAAQHGTNTRGTVYCELLLGTEVPQMGNETQMVDLIVLQFGSGGNPCDEALFAEIDLNLTKAFAPQFDNATIFFKNGPRGSLLDSFVPVTINGDPEIVPINGIPFVSPAAVTVPLAFAQVAFLGQAPYVPITVSRGATASFFGGQQQFRLVDENANRTFQMQSFSKIEGLAPINVTVEMLADLGTLLEPLPPGWKYEALSGVPAATVLPGNVVVLQDIFLNSYAEIDEEFPECTCSMINKVYSLDFACERPSKKLCKPLRSGATCKAKYHICRLSKQLPSSKPLSTQEIQASSEQGVAPGCFPSQHEGEVLAVEGLVTAKWDEFITVTEANGAFGVHVNITGVDLTFDGSPVGVADKVQVVGSVEEVEGLTVIQGVYGFVLKTSRLKKFKALPIRDICSFDVARGCSAADAFLEGSIVRLRNATLESAFGNGTFTADDGTGLALVGSAIFDVEAFVTATHAKNFSELVGIGDYRNGEYVILPRSEDDLIVAR